MGISWTNVRQSYKSPLRVVVQVLWRSRENKASKCRELKKRLDEARETIARQEAEISRRAEEFRRLQAELRRVEEQRRQAASRSGVGDEKDLPPI